MIDINESQNKFFNYLDGAKDVMSSLRVLETKYPFFRIQVPTILYNLTKDEFEFEAFFNLNLRAVNRDNPNYFFRLTLLQVIII